MSASPGPTGTWASATSAGPTREASAFVYKIRQMRQLLALVCALAAAAGVAWVSRPALSADTTHHLTLREGTNIAAAMSPDGRTIATDLLGSIWTLPAAGGKATRITPEYMDARQPSWSPDGKRLAFQAYVSSTWQIWSMNANGSEHHAVTSGPYDDREPAWSPDGARIAFSSDRGTGNYNIWTLTLATGVLHQETATPDNEFMPSWASGGELAFASDRRNKPGIYIGERLLAAAPGALSGAALSSDGASVAFNVIDGASSRLMVGGRNIADETEDVFPFRPQWISSTELLYTADGKIKRRPAAGGPARTIEFAADVSFDRPEFVPRRRNFDRTGPLPVRGIMHPAISPDGSQIVFCALGDLWLMPIGATPRKLTDDAFVEMAPAWSPDGKRVAYSSDRDGLMRIWIRDLATNGDRRLTAGSSMELDAAWSPDGSLVAFLDDAGAVYVATTDDSARGHDPAGAGSRGKSATMIHSRLNEPGRPTWSPDARFVVVPSLKPYSTRFREGTNQPLRIPVGGGDDTWIGPEALKSIGMREIGGPVWAPDGTQMAAIVDGHLAAWTVARDGTPTGPLRQLSDVAATPTWTADSRHLLYQTADRLQIVDTIDNHVVEVDPNHPGTPVRSLRLRQASRCMPADCGTVEQTMCARTWTS